MPGTGGSGSIRFVSAPKLSDYLARVPVTLDCEHTLGFARSMMVEHKIRHVPVVREGKVVGIVSERDIHALDRAIGDEADDLLIEKVMTPDPFITRSDADLATTAKEMAARRIGSVVLVDDGKLVGLFTTTDALRALAASLAR